MLLSGSCVHMRLCSLGQDASACCGHGTTPGIRPAECMWRRKVCVQARFSNNKGQHHSGIMLHEIFGLLESAEATARYCRHSAGTTDACPGACPAMSHSGAHQQSLKPRGTTSDTAHSTRLQWARDELLEPAVLTDFGIVCRHTRTHVTVQRRPGQPAGSAVSACTA